jgi:hypothetical protein
MVRLPGRGSELLEAGPAPMRAASGGGVIYAHACGGECFVWDILKNGELIFECDCGASPIELAADLGFPRDRLPEIELDISARMLAERTLETNPDDLNAKAVLHALGPT